MIFGIIITKFVDAEIRCNICKYRKQSKFFTEFNARMVLLRAFGTHVLHMHRNNFSGTLRIGKKSYPVGKIIPPQN